MMISGSMAREKRQVEANNLTLAQQILQENLVTMEDDKSSTYQKTKTCYIVDNDIPQTKKNIPPT